ncbi:MAG: TIGR03960 family B12-binding radical SAM protein [Clostridia bacterium]|nr:TIGR03960 family B12-binding radical SAM protein [Clostridia bacterium]
MKTLDSMLKLVEKPARYIGGEVNIAKKTITKDMVRFCFAFPDAYEIGMSYTGLQILYSLCNKEENIYCERTFAPSVDMEELMRENDLPLFTLETKTSIKDMDFFGFTLQYEMSFTNILNMLELAHIPLKKEYRSEDDPIVIAGGPCAYNPEPLADFIDVFLIGDGEELLPTFLNSYTKGEKKEDFLKKVCTLDGVYVPAFYDKDKKLYDKAPDKVVRAFVQDLDKTHFPVKPIVPLIEVVHDRSVVETFRGCTRGCRFCQAGMIYRPVRERSVDTILNIAKEQLEATGHDELSLLSLSTSDHSQFENLALSLMAYCKENNVSLSLPSLRLDSFSFKVLEEIQGYKKSGLTFAVEAGTQELRDVINKGVNEEDIYSAVEQAIDLGWRNIKLYFMIGLPFETYESLDGIAKIAENIVNIRRRMNGGKLGKFNVTVSVSNFVPKSNTPFQWFGQNTAKEFEEKHNYLAEKLRIKGVTFNYHDNETSVLEAVFARGDRDLGKVLLRAHELGCKFDGWTEHFNKEAWHKAFLDTGVDIDYYTTRNRDLDEVLAWDRIDAGISKKFLLDEWEKAKNAITTKDCRYGCTNCGINKHIKCPMGGVYHE